MDNRTIEVNIGYRHFIFEEVDEAVKFAEVAFRTARDRDEEVTVEITYKEEDE